MYNRDKLDNLPDRLITALPWPSPKDKSISMSVYVCVCVCVCVYVCVRVLLCFDLHWFCRELQLWRSIAFRLPTYRWKLELVHLSRTNSCSLLLKRWNKKNPQNKLNSLGSVNSNYLSNSTWKLCFSKKEKRKKKKKKKKKKNCPNKIVPSCVAIECPPPTSLGIIFFCFFHRSVWPGRNIPICLELCPLSFVWGSFYHAPPAPVWFSRKVFLVLWLLPSACILFILVLDKLFREPISQQGRLLDFPASVVAFAFLLWCSWPKIKKKYANSAHLQELAKCFPRSFAL